METLAVFVPLFVAVIAFSTFFTILGFVIKLSLKPLEINQQIMKEGLIRVESKLDQLLAK